MEEFKRIDMKKPKEMPDLFGMSLYESFDLIEFSSDQILQILTYHENLINEHSISSIDCYCEKCKRSSTFMSRNSDEKWLDEIYIMKDSHRALSRYFIEFDKKLRIEINKKEFFVRSFYCPRDKKSSSHDLTIILRVVDGVLTKIGQYPSKASIENTHLKKYKKLDEEIYKELNTAIGLNSHGVGVGAFVYLRRILEKYIVNPELEKLVASNDLSKSDFDKLYFKDKLVKLKSKLPSFLVDNSSIYTLLSGGIHEWEDSKCREFFPLLQKSIEMILDQKIELIEKEKKAKELKIELDKLSKGM